MSDARAPRCPRSRVRGDPEAAEAVAEGGPNPESEASQVLRLPASFRRPVRGHNGRVRCALLPFFPSQPSITSLTSHINDDDADVTLAGSGSACRPRRHASSPPQQSKTAKPVVVPTKEEHILLRLRISSTSAFCGAGRSQRARRRSCTGRTSSARLRARPIPWRL